VQTKASLDQFLIFNITSLGRIGLSWLLSYQEVNVKNLYLFLAIPVVVCLLASCTQQKLREARKGLDGSVAQLPSVSDFDVVTILSGESSITGSPKTCYYAQAYVVLGTSLSEEKALDVYVDELQSLGWTTERSDLENLRVLGRGMHEQIAVSYGGPGWTIETNEDYIRAKDIYPTIIFVTVDFMLPNRDEC
jgi:hypothetical protein